MIDWRVGGMDLGGVPFWADYWAGAEIFLRRQFLRWRSGKHGLKRWDGRANRVVLF